MRSPLKCQERFFGLNYRGKKLPFLVNVFFIKNQVRSEERISIKIQPTLVKPNAEKQRDYRERKKLEGPDFLEKERKRQKENYLKTPSL